ncbi:hypothetical protein [Paenibacillus sp. UNC451MF]|uniref:hypothetical protein n=1 Tax=Paenibacillus sp. UNC451MF TaxID=1449063 RepID=UPI003FA77F34
MRKLSGDARQSVEQINELIQHTNHYTVQVIDAIQGVQQLISSGQQGVIETNEVFTRIFSSHDSSITDIERVLPTNSLMYIYQCKKLIYFLLPWL